ncbi:hypothetical protein Mulvp2_32 [Enterobacter phage Mulvp2]|nr:hypothetical protein Mulvp2_32 [Enterobacter phage Mulvp2]
MTRKLIYTPDAAGEYTIAEESENWVTDIGQVENESDAILFCAAPDLLEALQGVVNKWTFGPAYNAPEFVAARAAIAKALGETK